MSKTLLTVLGFLLCLWIQCWPWLLLGQKDKMNHKFPVSTTQICCLLFLNFVTESQQTDHSPADALERASVATPQFLAQHVTWLYWIWKIKSWKCTGFPRYSNCLVTFVTTAATFAWLRWLINKENACHVSFSFFQMVTCHCSHLQVRLEELKVPYRKGK